MFPCHFGPFNHLRHCHLPVIWTINLCQRARSNTTKAIPKTNVSFLEVTVCQFPKLVPPHGSVCVEHVFHFVFGNLNDKFIIWAISVSVEVPSEFYEHYLPPLPSCLFNVFLVGVAAFVARFPRALLEVCVPSTGASGMDASSSGPRCAGTECGTGGTR